MNIKDIVNEIKVYVRDVDPDFAVEAVNRVKRDMARRHDFPWMKLGWFGITSGGTLDSAAVAGYNPSAMLLPPSFKREITVKIFLDNKPAAAQVALWRANPTSTPGDVGAGFRVVPTQAQLAWIRTNAPGLLTSISWNLLMPLLTDDINNVDDLKSVILLDTSRTADTVPTHYTLGTEREWGEHLGAGVYQQETYYGSEAPGELGSPFDRFMFFYPQVTVGTFYFLTMTYYAYPRDYGAAFLPAPQQSMGNYPHFPGCNSDGFSENCPEALIYGALSEIFDLNGDQKRAENFERKTQNAVRRIINDTISNKVMAVSNKVGGLSMRTPG